MWSLDLFVGEVTRGHVDIEIAVLAAQFDEIVADLSDYAWDVVGDGRIWQCPERLQTHFQIWLREPATGIYRPDVFREPVGRALAVPARPRHQRALCRTDPAHRRRQSRTSSPSALSFKAKHRRTKDQADFRRVLPELAAVRRSRLRTWLSRLHPGSRWIDAL
ncbi:hypothetical protein [Mycobacterium sp. MS1601]|uniref:hypothetical protein n=1 Tax=Mycobacterium sp. MS1601 TaxID=1936029 RepID=UPI001F4001C1|nr:hypothetical protein [Mycobacterium sp. MS1601]